MVQATFDHRYMVDVLRREELVTKSEFCIVSVLGSPKIRRCQLVITMIHPNAVVALSNCSKSKIVNLLNRNLILMHFQKLE